MHSLQCRRKRINARDGNEVDVVDRELAVAVDEVDAAAACAVEELGAAPSMPTAKEVAARLARA